MKLIFTKTKSCYVYWIRFDFVENKIITIYKAQAHE